jgi:inorganic phosphate transporter, PiT family
MDLAILLIASTVFLAYANGGNDNFKGVATLYGSGTLGYREAVTFATVAQIAGSVASVFLADTLVKAFSGKGLVPPEISASLPFLMSVGLGAGLTVMLATVLGFPISTTHALVGALVGTAYLANSGVVDLSVLGQSFVLPLLISPVLAAVLAAPLYKLGHAFVEQRGLMPESCACLVPASNSQFSDALAMTAGAPALPMIAIGTAAECQQHSYNGRVVGIRAQSLADGLHFVSAFALCFARGLNDTPKIFALLFAASLMNVELALGLIAGIMAIGGLLHARRVAETMSHDITSLNTGQALTANLVASLMVIGASRFGMPVSTTHVTVGAITGVGVIKGTAKLGVLRNILLSWVMTLPIAALIGYSSFGLLK